VRPQKTARATDARRRAEEPVFMEYSETPSPYRSELSDSAAADLPLSVANAVGEMPLFPLDVVLFPSMPLPLHIFEERYKEMINRCVRESRPFGIVLATGVDDVTGGVQTMDIGCTARIARVERLPDGRMNIEVIGESRFRILDTHEQLPYRVGLTETVEDSPADHAVVLPLADDVQRLLREFLTRSLSQAGQKVPEFDLPQDPEGLSFLAASVLPVENEEKQELLSEADTAGRLAAERDLLRREVTRLRRAAESLQILWKPVEADCFSDYLCLN
jgi:Lon protease-like protein